MFSYNHKEYLCKNERGKQMIKLKDAKGITLIALIITIIVLLILAVVAITSISNSNIIPHAKNARDDYSQAQANETKLLKDYENYIANEAKKAQ